MFPISEVVGGTGVPSPTIRYYVRVGLLPAPRRAGPKRFLYDERHVRAVHLIRALRAERRLPLRLIRRMLPGLLVLGEEGLRDAAWDAAIHRHGAGSVEGRLVRAAEALFVRQGLDRTSMAEIAAAVQIAKGSVYRRHPTKESLFFTVCEAAADRIAARVGEGRSGASNEVLVAALQAKLPLFLDLAAGATRRRPGFARAMERVLERLRGPARDGPRIIATALSRTLADLGR